MLWKLLLTAAMLVVAYLTLKSRLGRPAPTAADAARSPRPAQIRGSMRWIALGILGVMLSGSGWYLWRDWEYEHRVLEVQVVNAATGAIVPYRARRKDIEGRIVRTLDGREIRLADVERMVLTELPPGH